MKKTVILDTNVLLTDPMVMFQFPKTTVIIPITVIEELDKFKKSQDELGRNARHILKKIDKLVKKSETLGEISEQGIKLDNGGILIIEMNHTETIPQLDSNIADNRILSTAKHYMELAEKNNLALTKKETKGSKIQKEEHQVKLLTKDANLRIKANVFKVKAEDYDSNREFISDEKYSGYKMLEMTESQYQLLTEGKLVIKEHLNPNEYVVFMRKIEGLTSPVVTKRNAATGFMQMVRANASNSLFGIGPRNLEQQMAVDLLLDPNIPLVTITGKAGTGKTLLTVAAGLQQVVENNIYKKMLVSRPVVPMGKDIGYLPGTIEDKLNPWMQPIFDNLEFLMDAGSDSRRGQGSHKSQALIDQGFIQVEPLMYIRGRSIPNQFFVLDESQNLSKHEIKTILSRVGDGTKIILTGDPDQIDSPHLDKVSCGLSQVVEIFKGSPLAGHITLSKGERSQLAEAVVELFK